METTMTSVEQFFRQYAELTEKGSVPELVACFADVFLVGGPRGALAIRASDFALKLPKRMKLFESLGCRKTELAGLEETRLDARHVSARTRWRFTFERAGDEPLVLEIESTYLVDTRTEPFHFLV